MRVVIGLLLSVFLVGCGREEYTGIELPSPQQNDSDGEQWEHLDYTIESLATYEVTARVMSVQTYSDDGAELAPIDFALGWGNMANPGVYKPLKISQGGRWYRYRWGSDGPPIPEKEIVRSSANTHLIPKNDDVLEQLEAVDTDDIVELSGHLVKVNGPKGFRWKSSLKRTDTGGGACELMWVEQVRIVEHN